MAGRQVTYTTRSFVDIVNKLEPKRLSEPQAVYILDNGKVKTQRTELPGKDYPWVKDIEE